MKMNKLSLLLPVFAISCSATLASCGPKKETPVDPEALASFKESAIDTLNEYSATNEYRQEEANIILSTIEETTNAIQNATNFLLIDALLNEAIETITSLKTDEEYVLEEIPTYENSVSTPLSRSYARQGYEPVYKDINFREPIQVSKPLQNEKPYYYVDDCIDVFNKGHEGYNWQIAQWSSNYDLIGNGEETSGYTVTEDPTNPLIHTITSKGKTIDNEFVPAKEVTINSRTGAFKLTSNCGVEYNNQPRVPKAWVHLLLQQSYPVEPIFHLNSKTSIFLESEFTIEKCVDRLDPGAERTGDHCAQVVFYLQIRNKNEQSEGYGQTIWFGLPIFDSRNEGKIAPEYIEMDPGTNTLIVSPSSTEIYGDNEGKIPSVGQKTHIKIDLLPYMKDAIVKAVNRGKMKNTNFDDLYIAHTNFGFEMPGCYDISVSYDSLGVFAKADPNYVFPEPEVVEEN